MAGPVRVCYKSVTGHHTLASVGRSPEPLHITLLEKRDNGTAITRFQTEDGNTVSFTEYVELDSRSPFLLHGKNDPLKSKDRWIT